jgi:hypothetical protein
MVKADAINRSLTLKVAFLREGIMASDRVDVPAVTSPDRELVKEIARDIGEQAVSHLRIMYPLAYETLGKSGQRSLRNVVFNEIMEALKTVDAESIRDRLQERRAYRRKQHRVADHLQDVGFSADGK